MTTETAPKKKAPTRGAKPGERRGGRAKGTPNKATADFRETVRKLLEDNATNVGEWLAQVAGGIPALDQDGTPIHGKWVVEPSPDAALMRLSQLAEYAAPKLSRTEVVGDGGGPVIPPPITAADPREAAAAYLMIVKG